MRKQKKAIFVPVTNLAAIDWLSYVVHNTEPQAAIPSCYMTEYNIEGSRLKGYTNQFTTSEGVMVAWHDKLPSQGVMVNCTGSTLRRDDVAAYKINPHVLLAHCAEMKGQVTRIDYALDLIGDNHARPSTVEGWIASSALKFKGREYSPIRPQKKAREGGFEDAGNTLYIGSRSSDRFFRYYDKGKEKGLDKVTWDRLEAVIKGNRANGMTEALASDAFTCNRILAGEIVSYFVPNCEDAKDWFVLVQESLGEMQTYRRHRRVENPLLFFDNVLVPYLRNNLDLLGQERIEKLQSLINESIIRIDTV